MLKLFKIFVLYITKKADVYKSDLKQLFQNTMETKHIPKSVKKQLYFISYFKMAFNYKYLLFSLFKIEIEYPKE